MYRIETKNYMSTKRNLATAKCQARLFMHAQRDNTAANEICAAIYEVNETTWEKTLVNRFFVHDGELYLTDAQGNTINKTKWQ